MTKTPRIALTTLLHERNTFSGDWYIHPDRYSRALIEAGALPVAVPAFVTEDICDKYLDTAEGLLLIGGPDVPPELYGETPAPEVKPLPHSVALNHLALARKAFERNIPILGICLGMQELNVLNGGKLIQHLGDLTSRHRMDGADRYHMVELSSGSYLAEIFGTDAIEVNSAHHQAVDPAHAAPGASITAWSDGVVEAIEFPGNTFRIGVQWHPERIRIEEHRRKLFAAFTDSCRS